MAILQSYHLLTYHAMEKCLSESTAAGALFQLLRLKNNLSDSYVDTSKLNNLNKYLKQLNYKEGKQ